MAESSAVERLRGVLKSPWLACVLSALALAIFIVLVLRYHKGYTDRFFAVYLSVASILLAASLAAFLTGPTLRSACSLFLCAAAAVLVVAGALGKPRVHVPTAVEVYKAQLNAKARLFRHTLPGDLEVFQDGLDKTGLRSFSDLPRLASQYHARWRGDLLRQGFSENEAKAASMMLFTSTLWAFGNATHPEKEGCITVNEDNNWQKEQPTFHVVKRARIGCCTDYAYALSYILSRNGFENRYLSIPGHIFNEAKVDGKWYVLDANTNVLIDSAWNEAVAALDKLKIRVFAHPGSQGGKLHRPSVTAFQQYLVNLLLIGDFVKGEVKNGHVPDPEHKVAIQQLY